MRDPNPSEHWFLGNHWLLQILDLFTKLVDHRLQCQPDRGDRDWGRPDLALCLLVDASGSMSGSRLATAAVTAAACSWRAPGEYAVVSFARTVTCTGR